MADNIGKISIIEGDSIETVGGEYVEYVGSATYSTNGKLLVTAVNGKNFGDNPKDPPKPEDNTEYIYYTKEGTYLGGKEDSLKVYLSTQSEYDTAKKDEKWTLINKEDKLLKDGNREISNYDFNYVGYIVKMESGDNDLKELKCIAFASHNRSLNVKRTWSALLATKYSSVKNKQALKFSDNTSKSMKTRQAMILVLTGEEDITNGAEYWDGTDFLAWGNSEQNPYNKVGQNKFDEYKFIEIPKDIYDVFLAAQSTSTTYPDSSNHSSKNDSGTHEHITIKKKVKGKEVETKKIKYKIPAAEFEDKSKWISGSFYYITGISKINGLSATISAGKSIFWKVTPTRLTPSTPTSIKHK